MSLKLSKSQRLEREKNIIELYENGKSLEEIAQFYNVSKQTISERLIKAGYKPSTQRLRIKILNKIEAQADNILLKALEEANNKNVLLYKQNRVYQTRICQLKKQIIELKNTILKTNIQR